MRFINLLSFNLRSGIVYNKLDDNHVYVFTYDIENDEIYYKNSDDIKNELIEKVEVEHISLSDSLFTICVLSFISSVVSLLLINKDLFSDDKTTALSVLMIISLLYVLLYSQFKLK